MRVDSGIDENGNGVLDAGEVDASEVVCNGEDGVHALVAMSGEPAGVNCPSGGVRIDSGADVNNNGVLDASEITATEFVCNGTGVVGWLEPEVIETNQGSDATEPTVAVEPDGDAVAAWSQDDGSNNNIWANRFTVGVGWSGGERIENTDGGNAFEPDAAVDGSGNAVVVWRQWDGTRNNIRASYYLSGTGWQPDQAIETGDGSAVAASVAMDDGGNAIAVWSQDDGTRSNIWANRYVAGMGWSGPIELDEVDGDTAVPTLAMNASGEAIVAWRQTESGREDIAYNRFDPDSGWLGAELLETDDTGDAYHPAVAIDTNGRVTAVWAYDQGGPWDLRARRFDPVAGWSAATLIETSDASTGRPAVAMDTAGDAWVVWEQARNGAWDIWTNRYTGGAWQVAALLETNNSGTAREPRLAVSNGGYAVAVWRQWDGLRNNIWTNGFTPAAGWGYAQILEDELGDSWWPRVDVDAAGNAVAVWRQHDGSDLSVWANRFKR